MLIIALFMMLEHGSLSDTRTQLMHCFCPWPLSHVPSEVCAGLSTPCLYILSMHSCAPTKWTAIIYSPHFSGWETESQNGKWLPKCTY